MSWLYCFNCALAVIRLTVLNVSLPCRCFACACADQETEGAAFVSFHMLILYSLCISLWFVPFPSHNHLLICNIIHANNLIVSLIITTLFCILCSGS